MNLALAFIAVPVAVFLALAALPRGRIAIYGSLGAAVLAAVLWVTQMAGNDSYRVALITLSFSAIALAGFVQVVRLALGEGRPSWAYPLVVGLALIGAGFPMIKILGA